MKAVRCPAGCLRVMLMIHNQRCTTPEMADLYNILISMANNNFNFIFFMRIANMNVTYVCQRATGVMAYLPGARE